MHMLEGLLYGFGGYAWALIFSVVSSIGQPTANPIEGTPLWIVLGIEGLALVTVLYGAWLYYMDTMDQAWRFDAELHQHTRW